MGTWRPFSSTTATALSFGDYPPGQVRYDAGQPGCAMGQPPAALASTPPLISASVRHA